MNLFSMATEDPNNILDSDCGLTPQIGYGLLA